MSRHTWLTRPTEGKAERLLFAFDQAIAYGASIEQAITFAGYAVERDAQRQGRRVPFGEPPELIDAVVRGKWRLLRGKNAGNYRLTFRRHHKWLAPKLLPAVLENLGLTPDTPWQVAKDYALDHGRAAYHDLLTFLFVEETP